MFAKVKEQEFKTDDLKVKVTHKEGCIIQLEVEASLEIAKKAQKKAIKNVNKEIDLPGFRKGKAPEELILKQYSSNVDQKFQKSIADICFVEAQKLVKIYPLNVNTTINFNVKKYSLEEGAEVSFSYETEPTPPAIDPKSFKLKETKEPTVSEEKLSEAIRQAQFFYAKWTEVDRPIKEGDYVILDLDSLETDPPQTVFSHTRFEVKNKMIANWMKDLLLGTKKDEVLEGISKPDDDLPEEEKKKFEPKKVRIKIIKIEEAVLPELNDDFAKKIGSKNMEEMRKNIKEMLLKQEKELIDQQQRDEVNQFLLSTYKFDLPSSMLKSETKFRKDQALNDPRFKRSWDKMAEKEKQDFEGNVEKQAKEALCLFYLSRKIVDDAKTPITHKELHEEAINTIRMSTPPGMEPNLKNISRETTALALSKMFMKKAQEYILENSK